MNILFDTSSLNHKGIGRFTSTLLDTLKEMPYSLKKYNYKGNVYSINSFFRKIPKNKWDIYLTSHFIVPLNIILSRKTIILTIHDVIPFRKLSFKFYILYLYLFLILRLPNIKVLTPSQTSKQLISKFFYVQKNKIFVIYNKSFSNNLISEKNTIVHETRPKIKLLYIGNLKEHKNLKLILKACEIVERSKKDFLELVIVSGFKPNTTNMSNLNLKKNYIKILGNISDNDLDILIKESDYLIQPSFEEGFGIPILEALLRNTNVICSDIKVFRELFQGFAIFVNPYDPIVLSEIILNSYKINKQINTKSLKNKFDQKIITEQLKRVFS